jgi:hypothetical protein
MQAIKAPSLSDRINSVLRSSETRSRVTRASKDKEMVTTLMSLSEREAWKRITVTAVKPLKRARDRSKRSEMINLGKLKRKFKKQALVHVVSPSFYLTASSSKP